jgi:hypothetical protein
MSYPIGTPGQPWGPEEKAAWRARQQPQRSYRDDVLSQIEALKDFFDVEQYGTLNYTEGRYPLFGLRSRGWDATKPTVLVTGGVHGYETSGVHGALRFASEAGRYTDRFNIAVAPCISPWAYEVINRWNPDAIDPNRSFYDGSPAEESAALMRFAAALGPLLVHIDLHETTDTDNSEFRPAKAARDGKVPSSGPIPDGFYTVGHTERPEPDFQRAVIASVAQVTHIAPPDEHGQIIGEPVEQEGVISYDATTLGLCMGFSNATYTTTTEVYPDSPRASDEICIQAQVAAIVGALEHVA